MPAPSQEIKDTRSLIRELFQSQMQASRELRFHERTVRWWCKMGAPPHVLNALQRLWSGEIDLRTARRRMRKHRERREHGRRRVNGRPRA